MAESRGACYIRLGLPLSTSQSLQTMVSHLADSFASFNLYKSIEELKRVERKFAKALGIPIDQPESKEECTFIL